MNASNRLGTWHEALRMAGLCLLVAGPSCASQIRTGDPALTSQAQPLRIESIEIQTQGQVQALATGASLRVEQDFALKLRIDRPLHLYVVLDHADQRHELLHPAPATVGIPTGVGSLRLPAVGDWFFLPKVLAGDRLCLIASSEPQNNFSCGEPEPPGPPGRGEDQPPPPPAAPKEAKPAPTVSRPPPPDDTGRERGKARWVLPLPLSTP